MQPSGTQHQPVSFSLRVESLAHCNWIFINIVSELETELISVHRLLIKGA